MKHSIVELRWKKATKEDRKKQGEVIKNNLQNFLANLSEDELSAWHKKRGETRRLNRLKKLNQ